MAADQVLINEVFHSVQGESTWAGLPCVFIRLRGCPLRCHYCDTEYAFREGKARLVEEVVEEVAAIVRTCARHRRPIVARGAGTGLEGGAVAYGGGCVLDTRTLRAMTGFSISPPAAG